MSAPAAAGATSRPLDVLVLCNRPARGTNAGTIIDHLDAFRRASVHRIRELSFVRQLPSALDLEQFDVVAIHYTIAIGWMSHHFINPEAKRRLREFTGLKVAFLQDEYRHVDAAVEALDFMGVDLLFTCVPEGEIEKVYPVARLPRLAKRNNLTGYVPEPLLGVAVPPVAARPIDVGYRTRKPPYWLGELGWEKWAIADRFAARAQGCGLRLDLSYREQDRLYGEAWTRFVTSCRSMLGVESGASVFDFDGTLQPAVDAWVAAHPEATFEDVHARFLAPHEGRVRLNQISPRCFEAAALRTPMVLYEGEYSGILAPHRHFVPLRKDLANFDEVLDTIRDHARLQRIADCAYEEVARNPAYGYAAFVGAFDAAVSAEHAARCARRPAGRPAPPRYWRQIAASPNYLLQRAVSFLLQNAVLGTRLRNPLYRIWDRLPERVREFFRPLLRLMGR